jgi:predicted MFS family arabinose efflux permease
MLMALAVLAIALGAGLVVVLGIAALVSVASTAFEPAKKAILPSLATDPEQLTAANVASSTFESAAIFIGPAMGGALLAAAGFTVALAASCALLVCSVALLARIRRSPIERDQAGTERPGLLEEAFAGIRATAASPELRLVMGLFGAQLMIDGALGVFVVVVAIDLLELGRGGVGLLDSASGLGGLLGGVLALGLTGRAGLGRVFGLGIAAWGLPLALIPLLPSTGFVLAAFALIGVANTLVDASGFTLIQRITPDDIRGRVFGAFETLAIVSVGLGAVITTGLIALIGVNLSLVAVGAPAALLSAAFWGRLRGLDAALAPPGLDLLRGVPMFAWLGGAPLEALASRLERREAAAGEEIIRQGEAGDHFYVIEAGDVDVFEDGIFARREGRGDFFGEIALLRDVPRTATVIALTDVVLLCLERDPFIAAVSGHATGTEAAETVIAGRLGSVRAGAGSV